MDKEIITINNLSYTVNQHSILDDITITIPAGAFVAVLGENGAGKTTLLDLLMGFRIPSHGRLCVMNQEPCLDHWEARKTITYLSEKVDIPGDWSIREFLDFHQFFYDHYSLELERTLLEQFRISSTQRVGNLSAGEIRRAQIVAGLALQPKMVVVDEISAVLDIVGRRKFMKFLAEQNQVSHMTILFATNILEDLVNYISHVCLLRQSKLRAFVSVDDFLHGHQRSEFSQLVADMLEEE